MSSVSLVGRIVLVVVLLASRATADMIGGADRKFGRIDAIKNGVITFRPGCSPSSTPQSLQWNDSIRYVAFDPRCEPYPVTPPGAGVVQCAAPVIVFVVRFHSGEIVDASEIVLDGTKLRLKPVRGDGSWRETDKASVSTITREARCPPQATLPGNDENCVEPTQWAVNWSAAPVAANTIFTKGFAVLVRGDDPDGTTAEQVRFAFQSAITLWTSALLKHKDLIDPDLQAFLGTIMARSTQYSMLVAPQVVRVRCPQSAMSVVTIARDASLFADARMVAYAQVEGRAIVLNAGTFDFFAALAPESTDLGLNLVTVMTHELGHAFGLVDEYVSENESIMAGAQKDMRAVREPTRDDVRRFVRVLREPIAGSRPGEVYALKCAGLRVS